MWQVDIFMDASFAAVCMDVKFLQTKLSAEAGESSANTTPTAEETLNHLCQQCDSSLQFLQSLCQQKVFRECIVKNKVPNLNFFFFHLIGFHCLKSLLELLYGVKFGENI